MNITSGAEPQPHTILIIDDTPTNLAVVVDHLEDHGFRVAVARNGKEGIKRAKFVEPDLILLDVMMPEWDGFETCRRLKATETTKDIPVIFMTALEEATDKIAGFEAGGVDYITKPFQISEVLARINTHLALHNMQVKLAEQNVQMQQEITVRQRAESALQHARDDLEVRVVQRTAELSHANARLQAEIGERELAQKALQQARDELELRVQERTAELSEAYARIVSEVDERKQFEAALRLKNRAVESSINAIVITNCTTPANLIEYVNPAFERITGYRGEDALGRDIGFLFGDDKEQTGLTEIQTALRENREGRAALRSYRKDGSLFWNDLHIAPVRDEEGTFTHFVCILNDITNARDYEEELKRQASFDNLTGLPNRNLLLDRLAQAVALAQRPSYTVAIVFLDLDRFKLINDTLGHSAGDELLLVVAERLGASLRKSDTVARLGGDEFVLLLPDPAYPAASLTGGPQVDGSSVSSPPIVGVMKRILASLAEPMELAGQEFTISASAGVSFFPHDGRDPETLLKNADAAMYRAKEIGRNNFQFYHPEMNVRIAEQLSMETSLRHALERNEYTLYYQPKVDIAKRTVSGVEALLRWNCPERGTVMPAAFIPILERTGLINDVGAWVVERALEDQKQWEQAGLPIPRIAVNVSRVQLDEKNFIPSLMSALAKSGNGNPRLDLEITESLMMRNAEANIPKLKAVRAMGIGIAIDDFGTGYSSLSHLGTLPANVLKIDRSFVANITNNPTDRSIVYTVISLAHSLELRVVAEGVETMEQMALLSKFDCDEIQGYVLSKPLPLEQYLEWEKQFTATSKELLA
ncbi:MAG TPA: EAL domain-containing protein [Burkholderiales bacterium]|nr:EAL domain-containing protein [Burkholderiales bacterium]